MNNLPQSDDLFEEISQLVEQARHQVQRSVNTAMVQTYWHIGRLILEHEQRGERRAAYGKGQLKQLSERLTNRFGKGFDITNLRNMRRFYDAFPIRDAVRPELSWTHYRTLLRVENPSARDWYAREAAAQNWSARALERQIGVLYYERLLSSKEGRRWRPMPGRRPLPWPKTPETICATPISSIS
ncbi:DUF1016 N-terminal domain-containing protein [Microbulbifer magnicolonia]|uniref:DUF1016 N-terminal domain-containing protein n=1 Tax=Microbulbifer magnicolonia TaxID=3109744 RepID=UPI002B401F93|nr:DUF1016 N-terminal domain-containing protein [Microbulbifer sp. GG15]